MVSILSQMVKIFLLQTFHDKIDTFQYLNNINLSLFDKLISNERKAMKAIQILHYSLFGYILSLYLKYYFFKKTFKNTKILQGHKINYKYKSSTYFIIKSGSLTSKKMKLYLKSIQFSSKNQKLSSQAVRLIMTSFTETTIVCLVLQT